MSKKPVTPKAEAKKVVKDIRRATCKIHSAAEIQSLLYSWSKEFLEAGKKRLAGDRAH